MKWRNDTVAVIGIWFFISPWLFGLSGNVTLLWVSMIAGAVMFIASVWAATRPEMTANWSNWQNWVSLLAGVWFVAQPWLLNVSDNVSNTWQSVILGAVAVGLNLWTMAVGDELKLRR